MDQHRQRSLQLLLVHGQRASFHRYQFRRIRIGPSGQWPAVDSNWLYIMFEWAGAAACPRHRCPTVMVSQSACICSSLLSKATTRLAYQIFLRVPIRISANRSCWMAAATGRFPAYLRIMVSRRHCRGRMIKWSRCSATSSRYRKYCLEGSAVKKIFGGIFAPPPFPMRNYGNRLIKLPRLLKFPADHQFNIPRIGFHRHHSGNGILEIGNNPAIALDMPQIAQRMEFTLITSNQTAVELNGIWHGIIEHVQCLTKKVPLRSTATSEGLPSDESASRTTGSICSD